MVYNEMKMKKCLTVIVVLLLLAIFLPISSDLYAQVENQIDSRGQPVPDYLLKKISFGVKEMPLEKALTLLAEKGEFYINFNHELIPDDQYVSLTAEQLPVVEILYGFLEGTQIGFVISKSQQVVLVSRDDLEKEKKYTVSGFVTDAESGEDLVGTNVYLRSLNIGTTTNSYGFFSLTIRPGDYILSFSYMGYQTREIEIHLHQNIRQSVELNTLALLGDTVMVDAEVEDNILKTSEIGTFKLAPKDYENVPVFLGEQDIFRTIQLLPGITQAREADCGFYVRGGNSDQNLVLLDEAPVYNAVHLMGSFSVFNSDIVQDIKIIKGSAPAKYGGKLSSVLDIQTKEGNTKKFGGVVGIGTIFSRVTLEGPLLKDTASFIISGRRTYADIFTKLSSEETLKNSDMYFYDYNLKSNYRRSDKDRFYFSGYLGKDLLNVEEDEDIVSVIWENRTATLRWNHLFNEKLFSNFSFVYSRFNYNMGNVHEDETVDITSLVKDVTLKADFQYFNDAFNSFNFGVHYINHLYEPSQWLIDGSSFFDIRIGRRKAKELGVYISREQEFRNRFNVEYGLRYWLFSVSGEKDLFEIENIDEIPHEFYDLALHNAEEKLYTGFEPRFSLNYRLNTVSSIKLGYARNYQNVHMLSNSTSGTPLNVWHPSSSTVKPQRADQISLGYFRNFVNRRLELSGEVFYKDMRNQLDYKDGADFLLSSIFESELTAGRGWAYGVELLLKRETGRLNGWVGYTWSTSRRKFEEINGGNSFPALNDFTHDFAMVSIYNLSDKLIFSANWVYRTSAPVTIPYGNYMVDGKVLNAYTPRNAYRMPAYHRLDIGFTWRISRRSDLNITLYNAYGRKNAYAIVFDENQYNSLITEPMKLSLFSFVPSVSYQINF
jgi:hypothetical protein